ncbi:MAG TPA: ABC transporter permease [Gemmatimonadaceae bacterium]|nr:ABC transporter permease [Gemmatimonadaceae bacterium]
MKVGDQLKSLLWQQSIDEQVEAELDFHIEMVTRELEAAGMDPASAHTEALRRFGDLKGVTSRCREIGARTEREMRRSEYLSELRQDGSYALRQLARAPMFSAIAILTLAVGIGATTAIFSVVQSVVLRPFSFANPERVVFVAERWKDLDGNVSAGNYVDWREQSRSFEHLAAIDYLNVTLADPEAPDRVLGAQVTANFFPMLGVAPQLGRTFTAEEDQPGNEQVVVLSHEMWTTRFAANPSVLGQSIQLNGRPYVVIGVMPPGFDPTVSDEQLWMPVAFTPERRAEHDEHYLVVMGRLARGVSAEQANAEMVSIMRGLAQRYPDDNTARSARVISLQELILGNVRERLLVLLGAVALVLLIACGNVSNLLLARAAARAKEIAIRGAIGAGRGRIMRQLLTESLVLSLLAAVAGVALAYAMIRGLLASAPDNIPRLDETRLDWVVLAFALGTAVVSSVIFGLAPALRAARGHLNATLREGGRGMGTARDWVRSSLVAAQVGLALTLLTGAGLLVRSAVHLTRVPRGFETRGVVTARLALPDVSYREPARVERAFEDVVERLKGSPGVRSAAVVSQAPLGPGGNSNGLIPEGKPLSAEHAINARLRITSLDYVETMRIPLISGRWFTEQDVRGSELVMVVSETLARQAWPNESPLGKRIACCEGTPDEPGWKTVVGVVGDVRSFGPTQDVVPEFYLPMRQVPPVAWDWIQRTMTIVARGDLGESAIVPAMRAAVRELDPTLPLYSVSTMEEASRNAVAQERFNTILLSTLGALGLLLAAVGIYSVIAYFVSIRTHEIAVRMALGAKPRDVVALLTWQGVRPVLGGVALGVAGSIAATRLLRSSLYGVSAGDPLTLAGVIVVLVTVGLLATLVPARRAITVDPASALNAG